MEVENKQDKAYNLYINGLSLNQISKQSGLSKDALKRIEKAQKWDKILKKLREMSVVYNCDGEMYSFLCWMSLFCRADFLFIYSLSLKYSKYSSFSENEYLSSKLKELRLINKDLEYLYSFICLVYYSDKDCFERIFNEIKDFTNKITTSKV